MPDWICNILFALAGLVAGGCAAWLAVRSYYGGLLESARQDLKAYYENYLSASNSLAAAESRLEEMADLKSALAGREDEIRSLQEQSVKDQKRISELETTLEKERSYAEEKASMIEDAKKRMADSFHSMSARALAENNQSFLDLAGTTLSGYLESARQEFKNREQAVNEAVRPIADALEKYDQEIRSMERAREKAYGELSQQVVSLAQTQNELQRETGKLVSALRMPHVRGRWGELTLRRVVETAGMQNRCDFFEQVSGEDGGSLSRPDMIIQLPGSRRVVVDSKVPIAAYLDSLEAECQEKSEDMLARHARHVQAHVHKLARKSYWAQFAPAPEFVVLFMPGENFFSAALSKMPGLIEEAADKGVILATPTTLISLLKAVAYSWKQETAAENARAVSELGSELYSRLHSMISHMNKLGRDLERCVSSFNQTVGSMEKRVMPSARKLRDTGATLRSGRPLQDLSSVEEKPRGINTGEGSDD